MLSKIHVGTSGWYYDHWIGPFYPDKTPKENLLEEYAKSFHTVEVNNSFYHLPQEETFLNWKNQTPSDFIFSVKASRYITHMKNLLDPKEPLERFFKRVNLIDKKLGAILFQLPPNWHINLDRFKNFVDFLSKEHPIAFEFREPSWFSDHIYTILEQGNYAFCIYQLGEKESPILTTADFVYIRLHGGEGPYKGNYSNEELASWSERINEWVSVGKEIYCYFDNDEKGYAPKNALELIHMLNR